MKDDHPMVWINIHTGLGKLGKDTLLFETGKMEVSTLQKYFPLAEKIVTPIVLDKKALSGYDLVKGTVISFWHEQQQQEQEKPALFLTQELGTLPGVLMGLYLILEKMMYHHGNNTKNNKETGCQWMQSAFYPQSTEWRASIVQ